MNKQPRCPTCRRKLAQRILYVVEGVCWKCGAKMPMSFVDCDCTIMNPPEFTREEIDLAAAKGVRLEERNSYGECELCNICPSCNVLTANCYIHPFVHLSRQVPGISTSLHCFYCAGLLDPQDLE
jgi:hypothetical protein